MRYLSIILCVLFTHAALGQSQPPNQVFNGVLYQYKNSLRIDSNLFVPKRDTAGFNSALSVGGNIRWRPADSLFYGYNGIRWRPFLSGDEALISDSSLISTWGANGDTTIDFTATLNNAVMWAAKKPIRYLNIDRNIKVNNRIAFLKNRVLFIGIGRIFTYNINNYGEAEVGGEYTFVGEVNNKFIYSKTAQLIGNSDTVRIVVWGNSISVGYDADFTKFNPDPHYIEQRATTNSWYDYFLKKMWLLYRGRPIKIYNRSAGGYRIEDYNRVLSTFCCGSVDRFKTATNQDSTWVQVIKQLQPDLIIMSLGMNDSDEYIKWFYRAKDSINTWTKQPEIVLMSTPSPNYINDATFGDFGDYDKRVTKMNISTQQRWVSNTEKYYLIDVAKLHDVSRYGTDYTNFSIGKSNGYYFDSLSNISLSTLTSFTTSGASSTIRAARKNKTRDYAVEFNWQYSGTFSYFDIRNSQYSISRILPTGIDLYSFVVPSERNIGYISVPYTFTAGVNYKITAIHNYNSMRVYVNDSLIATSPYGMIAMVTDPFLEFMGSSGTHTVTNFSVYDAYYKKYLPSVTGSDMWGDTTDLINGNHINHPAMDGLNSTYFKAVDLFVGDLSDYVTRNDSTNLQWAYNGSTLYNKRLHNVGIGRTAASEKLSVAGKALFDMGGSLLSPIDTRLLRWGVSIHANTDTAKIWLESTGDQDGKSNMILEMADNRTSTGGPTEGFIFRKSGSGDVPPVSDFDILKINQDSIYSAVKVSGTSAQMATQINVGGYNNGFIRLNNGDPTNAGWMGFYLGNGTRIGYLGSSPSSRLDYNAEGGAVHFFNGGNVGVLNSNPTSALHTTSFAAAIITTSGNITLDGTHYTVKVNNSSDVSINLPLASTCAGRVYRIKKISNNANTVTITAAGSDTIDGAATNVISSQWLSVEIQSDGTAWSIH